MIRRGRSAKARRARSGVPGKLGRVRLYGKALQALRRDCFERDGWKCTCGCGLSVTWITGDMAHIVSRGAGGSDTLDNVRTMTHDCHMLSHNCGGKPLPAKAGNPD